ncbi:hypothetical protein C0Q70_17678 [Pomacea canaliculata]|uniref:Uncharacterized protein n=1 Tax=Pomacea canaliculata TaxID=400727 RepID=A0A2T7NL36_POMCA|nr:hypothetical protein C0Q70_17678 [Pomacea canaliculata]
MLSNQLGGSSGAGGALEELTGTVEEIQLVLEAEDRRTHERPEEFSKECIKMLSFAIARRNILSDSEITRDIHTFLHFTSAESCRPLIDGINSNIWYRAAHGTLGMVGGGGWRIDVNHSRHAHPFAETEALAAVSDVSAQRDEDLLRCQLLVKEAGGGRKHSQDCRLIHSHAPAIADYLPCGRQSLEAMGLNQSRALVLGKDYSYFA